MLSNMRNLTITVTLWLLAGLVSATEQPVAGLYQTHCGECHGANRLGAIGPALLPQNLKRLRKKSAAKVIRESRPAVQMPAFGGVLSEQQIESLVELIYTPLEKIPDWGMKEIRASQLLPAKGEKLSQQPLFEADVSNLFMVVELGDHHATLLNGDTFEPIHRLPTRFALHGGPRCCKRNTYLALTEAVAFLKEHFGVELEINKNIACEFYDNNKECLADECDYYPADLR